jgi:hypothetical protein
MEILVDDYVPRMPTISSYTEEEGEHVSSTVTLVELRHLTSRKIYG